MTNRIKQLLDDKGSNYILPFFWQHGEDEATLRKYMEVIQASGIHAVCVECRPHPDFCGPKWWHDLDIIMDEARKRNMRVWVLDDAHFPTGQANGKMEDAPLELRKQYLYYNIKDVCGPMSSCEFKLDSLARYTDMGWMQAASARKAPIYDDDRMIAVVATKCSDTTIDGKNIVDLTHLVSDGKLIWNVPEGTWRVFVLYLTRNGGQPNYINMVDFKSCRVQIDAVYEPHFNRYKDDFGKTFAGFFSDEPAVGNILGHSGFDNKIGTNMILPWSTEVEIALKSRLGEQYYLTFPALWFETSDSETAARIRYTYMDVITDLINKNFSLQIGDWCSAHGVEYIGHTIEDNNQHARLGQSFGHHFRGLGGQHMGGIDDIGEQVKLGGEDNFRASMRYKELTADGEFYHFILGKLGSSQGHLDPRMKGRSMCEIFGAYGWGEGTRLMKYLTDHFIVRGINHYVPHAFSPKAFPDPDCPPHFYAHGYNPLYRAFGKLMHYMNRMCAIINDGKHVAPAALYYHAEAEWTGDYMLMQKPARVLLENQVDFDIVWNDQFVNRSYFGTSLKDSKLYINGEQFKTLIVPYTEYITSSFAEFVKEAKANGFPVVFINELPKGICDPTDDNQTNSLLNGIAGTPVVSLDNLSNWLTENAIPEVKLSAPFRRLRYIHYAHENDIYIFTNEDPSLPFEGTVYVSATGTPVIYDAYENVLRQVKSEATDSGTRLYIKLEAYQSIVVDFGCSSGVELVPYPITDGIKTQLDRDWDISLNYALDRNYPDFKEAQTIGTLKSISNIDPDFSGIIRYAKDITLDHSKHVTLDLGEVYEAAEVWVNGQHAGMCICPPYRFDITKYVHPGNNNLRIEVATTLERAAATFKMEGMYSLFFSSNVLAPTGMLGPVTIISE